MAEERSIPILLVDLNPVADLLVSAQGERVWPVRSEEEKLALTAFMNSVGGCLREAVGHPIDASDHSLEYVICLGERWAREGALYAHLTHRISKVCATPEEVFRQERCAVVVVAAEALTSRFLDQLATYTQNDSACGIFAIYDESVVREQVLVRSAASAIAKVACPRIEKVETYPLYDLAIREHDGALVLGGKASNAVVKESLSSGADVLTSLTHSDGLDAFMGSGLTLCGVNHLPRAVKAERIPHCVLTNQCFRHNCSLEAKVASESHVDPLDIKAKILVWAVCFGVLCEGALVDPQWSVLTSLLASPTIGCVVTTWSLVMLSGDVLAELLADIYSHVPIGMAVSRFNRSRVAIDTGVRLALFGDPMVVSSGVFPNRTTYFRKSSETSEEVHEIAIAETDFLAAYLSNVKSKCPAPIAERAETAFGAALKHLALLQNGKESDVLAASETSVRESVLNLIARLGTVISHDWVLLKRESYSNSSGCCARCESPIVSLFFKFRVRQWVERRLDICPVCGITYDGPKRGKTTLTCNDGVFTLKNFRPRRPWLGMLRLSAPDNINVVCTAWPQHEDGFPYQSISLKGATPSGLLKVSFVVVEGTALSIVSTVTTVESPSV